MAFRAVREAADLSAVVANVTETMTPIAEMRIRCEITYHGAPCWSSTSLHIRGKDQQQILLSAGSLSDFDQFSKRLLDMTAQFMIPRYQAELERQGEARFNAVSIRPEGIHSWGKLLHWKELKSIEDEGAMLRIIQVPYQLWAQFEPDAIPNLHVFLP